MISDEKHTKEVWLFSLILMVSVIIFILINYFINDEYGVKKIYIKYLYNRNCSLINNEITHNLFLYCYDDDSFWRCNYDGVCEKLDESLTLITISHAVVIMMGFVKS